MFSCTLYMLFFFCLVLIIDNIVGWTFFHIIIIIIIFQIWDLSDPEGKGYLDKRVRVFAVSYESRYILWRWRWAFFVYIFMHYRIIIIIINTIMPQYVTYSTNPYVTIMCILFTSDDVSLLVLFFSPCFVGFLYCTKARGFSTEWQWCQSGLPEPDHVNTCS